MKLNLTIRQAILLLLALFGLMIGGATFFIVRYVTNMCIEKEYLDDRSSWPVRLKRAWTKTTGILSVS